MKQPVCISLVNGVPTDLICIADRGLAYGHGVFETVRVHRAQPNLLDYHLERLTCGAKRLQIPIVADVVVRQLEQLLELAAARQWRDGVAKIVVTAGAGGRGYAAPNQVTANIVVQWHPLPEISQGAVRDGVRLKLCSYRLPKNPPLAGLKHLNRLDQVIARAELEDGFQEGLLLDADDRVIEGVSSNVFVRIGGQLVTPLLDNCGVAGVMRRMVVEKLCPALNLPCVQRSIMADELKRADEMFICNSLCGIYPVSEVVPLTAFAIGEWTRNLQSALQRELPCYAI